ncbi:scarecrow-like protein 15 [Senna tora]|uniref:Scarecrow-like protein 15 n=1 Tax=Senna tora TaxID=362788 RepID=A0A834TVA7_9FABA|nr:scarecrow-like protein 15 [Senna tora]
MRVPVTSSPHHSPKPTNNISTIRTNLIPHITPTSCYEPTSVLDLCRSPSPEKPSASLSKPPEHQSSLDLDDHVLHSLDWDSIMKDLGLHDDSVATVFKTSTLPPSQEPPFDFTLSDLTYINQNLGYNSFDHLVHDFNQSGNWNNGFDFIEELIRAADCFDTNQLQLAHVILERLNQRLRSPVGKPLHRAAFYFKDALQSLLSGSNRTPRISSLVEIVQSIRAFKAFSGISPIPMFSIFTTNQALLEALHGSSFMHVIDFDIGLGIQYASLMKEIAEKAESCKINSPVLRITAVVPEEYAVESRLIRENLNQFAQELRIRVQVEFVLMRTFETLSLKAVKFMDGEKTAVLVSPTIFRRLGSTKSIAAFLGDIRRVSPSVVVFVDGEGWTDAAAATSFRRGVVNSLEFYSMMLESLDASMVGGGGDWVRRIEMLLLRPKMLAAVEGGGRRVPAWRELFYGAGMRAVQLSQFADFQAECLLAKVQIRGFHVAKRQAELVLLWNERPMVSTSAWRC